jgi:pyruvate formate-lyase activating enzyme-like uncharacterized protein
MFPSLNIHYCTSKLKDSVQLAKRIKKRAKNIKEKFDIVTDEGMLIRGAIYLDKDIKRKFRLSDLQEAKKKINLNEIKIDERKSRLLLSKKNVIKFSNKIKSLGYIPAVVEEYPTWDSLEIDVNFI